MNDSIIALSCEDFVRVLSSSAPVPGGGGAAALVGAIGTALSGMVGSLTVGKKKYADVQEEVLSLKAQSDELHAKLLSMVDKDAKAFEPLSRAYGLPGSTDEEKAEKAQIMEVALKEASEPPFEIMNLCLDSINVIERFSKIGSKLAISDAGCAAACCKAALNAACLNVFINTRLMKDRAYADAINKRAEEMLELGSVKADAIFDTVRAQLL